MKKRKKSNKNITINISNRWMYTILTVMILILGVAVVNSVAWDTSKTVYHDANDVKIDIGSSNKSLQDAFNDGDLGGSSSLWQSVTGGLYYGQNIGLGVEDPTEKLEIDGSISANELLLNGSRIWIDTDTSQLCYNAEAVMYCDGNTELKTCDDNYFWIKDTDGFKVNGENLDCAHANSDCNSFCMGSDTAFFDGITGVMTQTVPFPANNCDGDLYSSPTCTGGTSTTATKFYLSGSAVSCKSTDGIRCSCNSGTYHEEVGSYVGGTDVCL